MKTLKRIFLAGLLTAWPALASAAEIPWSSLTGGGGLGQFGAVALGGAFGPIAPALSPAAGGNYTLTGGFWPVLDGQPQPVRPVLKVELIAQGTKVLLSWPVNVTGFVLEYTTQLGSGVWHPENAPVVDTSTAHTVTVSAGGLVQAYRLRSL